MTLPVVRRKEKYHQRLQIIPVRGRLALRRFIRLPWSIYTNDPAWVPPLLLERRLHLSPRNPYFEHARWRAWIAYRNKRPVGRISAQVDRLHLERYQDATGFFGMLEAEDEAETFHALLKTAEGWLREQGLHRILGPFNLSINEECGLLVDGFDTPPMFMMGHAQPYYSARIEAQGYAKVQDLLAYRVKPEFKAPAAMRALCSRAAGSVRLRPLRRSRLDEELHILRDIFNDAWSQNWGFVPFTEAEFDELGRNLTWVVDDDFVQIAEVDGDPAAMIVALPNVNEAIRDLDGRLLPLGWIKLLWRLKRAYPKTARVPLMGVRKRYQQSLLGAALAFMVIDALRAAVIRRGIQAVEMSWILEDNASMCELIDALGGLKYKRYRVYQKELGGARNLV